MRSIPTITAKDNPLIKHYRKLLQQKKARRTEGLFVIEGFRIVMDAMQHAVHMQQVFVTDSAFEKFGTALQESMPEIGRLCRISDAVGKTMSDTEHTQGVFAICYAPQPLSLSRLLEKKGRYLVLCELQDPGNMGMILRTADALAIDAVLSCRSCELYSPKVVRATMGSVFRVPVYECSEEAELLQQLQQAGVHSYAAVPSSAAVPLTDCRFSQNSAVWIGNEGNGLPAELIAACETAVTIPMQGGPESLNAAMAAGIFMWEMKKNGG